MTPKFEAVYKNLHLNIPCKSSHSIFSGCQGNKTYCCFSKLDKNVSSSKGLEGIYWGHDHILCFMICHKFCGHSILGQGAYSALLKVWYCHLAHSYRICEIEWYFPREQSVPRRASLLMYCHLQRWRLYPGPADFQLSQLEGGIHSLSLYILHSSMLSSDVTTFRKMSLYIFPSNLSLVWIPVYLFLDDFIPYKLIAGSIC